MIDIKKIKIKLFNEISNAIWIKIYSIISIILIHLIWLFSILFLNSNDSYKIYGLPYFLILPYILYISADLSNKETIASEKINKYLNYIMTFYLLFIILISIISNNIKRDYMNCLRRLFNRYI